MANHGVTKIPLPPPLITEPRTKMEPNEYVRPFYFSNRRSALVIALTVILFLPISGSITSSSKTPHLSDRIYKHCTKTKWNSSCNLTLDIDCKLPGSTLALVRAVVLLVDRRRTYSAGCKARIYEFGQRRIQYTDIFYSLPS